MPEMIAAWASGFALGLLLIAILMNAKTSASVARLERKVDALLKQSGIDLAAVAVREAEALVKAGRKIEAIKLYREMTGAGLAEAKAAVENL
jgi:ribosomal protein L7/L12